MPDHRYSDSNPQAEDQGSGEQEGQGEQQEMIPGQTHSPTTGRPYEEAERYTGPQDQEGETEGMADDGTNEGTDPDAGE